MNETLGIKRTPTQQDLSWFLDLYKWQQLDLNPSYQRKSIWGRSDKVFFLNTIFNNYPCPAIYVQKEIKNGKTMYYIVDGKQRLQTIFDFFENKISIPSDFGDDRLNGKKWKDIENNLELARLYFDYNFTVEVLTGLQNEQWNEVFDRLNRNAKVLTDQELRHARFNGWLITEIEKEADEEKLDKDVRFWKNIGISTRNRIARMKDIEFISILMLVVLEKGFVGFPQSSLNELYLKYDKIVDEDEDPEYDNCYFTQNDAQNALNRFAKIKSFIMEIENTTKLLSSSFFRRKTITHVYSLWTYFALNNIEEISDKIINNINTFYKKLEILTNSEPTQYPELIKQDCSYQYILDYFESSTGAATEVPLRQKRHCALTEYLKEV